MSKIKICSYNSSQVIKRIARPIAIPQIENFNSQPAQIVQFGEASEDVAQTLVVVDQKHQLGQLVKL